MTRSIVPVALLVVLSTAGHAHAQCNGWADRFDMRGPDLAVKALAVFDDGGGPKLYAGGDFTTVGTVEARYLARFDGAEWTALAGGELNGKVAGLSVFDDGSGPALYAAGQFTAAGSTTMYFVGKWDGASWSPLGSGLGDGTASTLAVFDDGSGPALYVGGAFSTVGGMSDTWNVAKWNGAAWSQLGDGTDGGISALAVFDDGSGLALYAGGSFTIAGGIPANNVAKWNGSTWSALGTGTAGTSVFGGRVYALATFNGALYAGGHFDTAGGVAAARIARWNGSAWSAVGTGMGLGSGPSYLAVYSLTRFDYGSGESLYAGGHFTRAGGQNVGTIARWDGATWSGLGNGIHHPGQSAGVHTVHAMTTYDDGSGAKLYAGGSFLLDDSGSHANNLARWDGADWTETAFGQGIGGSQSNVYAMTVFDDGQHGRSLYACGLFLQAGASLAFKAARWNGSEWTGLTVAGVVDARAVLGVEDAFGAGPTVYAGGTYFNCGGLSRLSGSGALPPVGFSYAGGGANAVVHALAYYDDGSGSGPSLFVGGRFDEVDCDNPVPMAGIARWNGTTMSSVGGGMGGTNPHVNALTVFDDGSGPALFAGGTFTQAGGTSANRVAKWNGSSWSALGAGVSSISALCAFDDGAGAGFQLYAASGSSVRRWDGASWSLVGGAFDQAVLALAGFDDGTGPALYAGGVFTAVGGASANYIAKWDGTAWSAIGSGTNAAVQSLAVYDDGLGGGPDLYLGGGFTRAGDVDSRYIAELHGCHAGESYCAGDDLDALVTADCPCGNVGAPHHGCANSWFASGSLLTASGTTSPNTILFTCTDLPNNTLCTFLRGNNNTAAGFVFGDGVRCVQVPLFRFGQQNAGQNGNPPSTVASPTVTEPAGVTRYYQCQYRNPVAGWCDPGLFNVSNGYMLSW